MIKRHEQILKVINRDKEISVNALSQLFDVSVVTIRSDLRALEEQNLLVRTHGGASLPGIDDITRRLSINYPVKQRIAAAAAACVREGETILLEAGSCVALMARELVRRRGINVITNNAFVARQLKDASGISVILMGGTYQKESETMVGAMVREYLGYYNFSKVFLGMDGFARDQGVMCRDLERAEVMSEFVRRGEEVYFLSDSSKLGRKAVRTICSPGEMGCLITDSGMDPEYGTFFDKQGIRLILA